MIFNKFPDGFLWGASTSAHQIEGDNNNDWTEFEKRHADRLASDAKKLKFFFDKFAKQAEDPRNYISGLASGHRENFENDFYLASKIGLNSYRFSIEWSRIEPEKGKFDEEAVKYYKNIIRVLRTYRIEPFITLWHWTIPAWFAREGGFKNRKNIKYFLRFVKKIVTELKDDADYFITLNEPEIYSVHAYLMGSWPPCKKGIYGFVQVFNNLILAHQASYSIIKNINPDSRVGVAKNNIYFEMADGSFKNKTLKKAGDFFWNDYFLKKISKYQDFIGLNYYFRNRIDGWYNKNRNAKASDLGWDLCPEGIFNVLSDLGKYNKPIFVTENGLADADDRHRQWFIAETVKAMAKAIQKGVDLRGYFHWSLLDNFEWDKGFWPRFGLIEVDYKTQKRTLRDSALYYGEIISAYNRSRERKK